MDCRLLAIDRLFGPLARVIGARDGMTLQDPDGLPVVAVIAVACLALSALAVNSFIREINVAADQYSLDHAREPDGLAASLVRSWRADKVDPGLLEEGVWYNHPSLAHRVRHAMNWKVAHPRLP